MRLPWANLFLPCTYTWSNKWDQHVKVVKQRKKSIMIWLVQLIIVSQNIRKMRDVICQGHPFTDHSNEVTNSLTMKVQDHIPRRYQLWQEAVSSLISKQMVKEDSPFYSSTQKVLLKLFRNSNKPKTSNEGNMITELYREKNLLACVFNHNKKQTRD